MPGGPQSHPIPGGMYDDGRWLKGLKQGFPVPERWTGRSLSPRPTPATPPSNGSSTATGMSRTADEPAPSLGDRSVPTLLRRAQTSRRTTGGPTGNRTQNPQIKSPLSTRFWLGILRIRNRVRALKMARILSAKVRLWLPRTPPREVRCRRVTAASKGMVGDLAGSKSSSGPNGAGTTHWVVSPPMAGALRGK